MLKRWWVLSLLFLFLCSGCGPGQKEHSVSFFSMDTYCTVTLTGSESAAEAAEQLCFELNGLLGPEDSELSQLNQAADGQPHRVSDQLMELLAEGLALSEETDGLCHITAGALTDRWGFSTGDYRLPAQEEIDDALKSWGQVELDEQAGTVTLPEGGMLTLGAFAKGMAADRCGQLMKEQGVTSALIALGGSLNAVGVRPDGQGWQVAVRDPRGEASDWIGVLSLEDSSVSTSGGYERYFEQDGVVYHHILDPRTGYPAETDLLSATVVADSGALADAFSTTLFLLGEEQALALTESRSDLEAILVTRDGRVVVTAGLSDSFQFTGGANGYTLEQRG